MQSSAVSKRVIGRALQEELAVSKARAQSWEDMAQAKSAELEQCRGQLRMRDFSIRIFHESSAPIDVKQSIVSSLLQNLWIHGTVITHRRVP